jgi:hypothetical protein
MISIRVLFILFLLVGVGAIAWYTSTTSKEANPLGTFNYAYPGSDSELIERHIFWKVGNSG